MDDLRGGQPHPTAFHKDGQDWMGSRRQGPPEPVIAITGGEVIDPTGRRMADVYMVGGQIHGVYDRPDPQPPVEAAATLDATGCVVSTGLVDMFARFGQPGNEQVEGFASGSYAATCGGFTTVLAQPDTDPPVSSLEMVGSQELALTEIFENSGLAARILLAATVTADGAGRQLAPLAELSELADVNATLVKWFTDVGPITDTRLLLRALQYGRPLGAVISVQPTDLHLAADAAMAEGPTSSLMGIHGEPAVSEEVAVATALALVRHADAAHRHLLDINRVGPVSGERPSILDGNHPPAGRANPWAREELSLPDLHLDRISTAAAVDAVRRAKAEGLAVSASVTANHLLLTDRDCADFNPLMRNTPPYRTEADRQALVEGVADGTIDAIVSGHSPALGEQVDVPFAEAYPGSLGLPTALAVTLAAGLTIEQALRALSWRPAQLLLDIDSVLQPGAQADLVVIDPSKAWTLEPYGFNPHGIHQLSSPASNTPHLGRKFTGQVRHTVFRGRPTVVDFVDQGKSGWYL